jgi:phosphoesterase RecJ-like protein
VNVARIAEKFGGGGHRNAAGCTLEGELEEAERTIVRLLQNAVNHRNGDRDDSPAPTESSTRTEAAA